MTCSTSRANGSIPVLSSTRSNRLAWWTSQAAVGQRAAAAVLELDQRGAAWTGRHRFVATAERLELRLLVGADDVLVGSEPLAVEDPGVEVQRAASLLGEVGVAREDPRSGLPRLDRVVVQPAP